MITHELKCRFCGTKTGEFSLPEGTSLEQAGVVDIRCGPCEGKHGVFQDLERRFKDEVADDQGEFLAAMEKAEFKGEKLEPIIEEMKPAPVEEEAAPTGPSA